MPANRPKNNVCACGCGTMVTGTWARGHQLRGGPLPGPDDPLDVGELLPQPQPADEPGPGPGDGSPAGPGYPDPEPPRGRLRAAAGKLLGSEDQGERLDPDPPPAHLGAKPAKGKPPKGKPVKVAATVRGDIEAKLGLMLEIPGRVWQARDPYCGGVFVESLPAIRPAMVELICQSSDLVEWFTGVGGGFMLWLNLAAACQPVLVTIWAHHITHTLGAAEGAEGPGGNPTVDLSGYAA